MSKRIHIFSGPSLPPSVQPRLPNIVFHGPVTQGDVYALVAEKPFAIGIIDGYFERLPAVWHKEILWAMSNGIHVLGAASLGALRAVELAAFGMQGVGQVFEEFRTGRLTDDDEVTIVHAEAEWDYRPGSDAMVNLRATLDDACAAGVIDEAARVSLVDRTKQHFYPDRSYAQLLTTAAELLDSTEHERFASWLRVPTSQRDLKRMDALTLLEHMSTLREGDGGPLHVKWTFQHTEAWEQVRRDIARRAPLVPTKTELPFRAEGATGKELASSAGSALRDAALLRRLQIEAAKRDGFVPTENDIAIGISEIARRYGLLTSEQFQSWMREQGLSEAELDRLLRDEACVRRATTLSEEAEQSAIWDLLRLRPDLPRGP